MGKSDIAADLLARSFASGESMVNTKGVSRHLAEMAGRSRAELFWGSKRAAQDFVAVTECALPRCGIPAFAGMTWWLSVVRA